MAKIWCCRRFQDAEIFKINPTRKGVLEEFVLYVQGCSCCSQPVLEILRADFDENILKPVRLNPDKIPSFIKKMNVIGFLSGIKACKSIFEGTEDLNAFLKKPAKGFYHKTKISKFVLNYNQFGKIKKCAKNFSNLDLGKIETDPVINLKTYKKHLSRMAK